MINKNEDMRNSTKEEIKEITENADEYVELAFEKE